MGEQEQNGNVEAGANEGTDAKSIFLVLPLMSSPNKIADTTTIDDTHREVTLEWGQEMRDKITAVRKEYYPKVRAKCVSIYGLSFAKNIVLVAMVLLIVFGTRRARRALSFSQS
jgi:hypothetical protein